MFTCLRLENVNSPYSHGQTGTTHWDTNPSLRKSSLCSVTQSSTPQPPPLPPKYNWGLFDVKAIRAGLPSCSPQAKSELLTVPVNKVLLARSPPFASHHHSCTPGAAVETNLATGTVCAPESWKYWSSGLFQKKLTNPYSGMRFLLKCFRTFKKILSVEYYLVI